MSGSSLEINALIEPYGFTLLHFASYQGQAETCELLINRGADINIKDTQGRTPLHLAAEKGFMEVVCLLVCYGSNLFMINSTNQTAEEVAFYYGQHEVFMLLNYVRIGKIKIKDIKNSWNTNNNNERSFVSTFSFGSKSNSSKRPKLLFSNSNSISHSTCSKKPIDDKRREQESDSDEEISRPPHHAGLSRRLSSVLQGLVESMRKKEEEKDHHQVKRSQDEGQKLSGLSRWKSAWSVREKKTKTIKKSSSSASF